METFAIASQIWARGAAALDVSEVLRSESSGSFGEHENSIEQKVLSGNSNRNERMGPSHGPVHAHNESDQTESIRLTSAKLRTRRAAMGATLSIRVESVWAIANQGVPSVIHKNVQCVIEPFTFQRAFLAIWEDKRSTSREVQDLHRR